MIRGKKFALFLASAAILSLVAFASGAWTEVFVAPVDGSADWFFRNTTGVTANALRLEFEEEVTLRYVQIIGGDVQLGGMALVGSMTGRTFDFVGGVVTLGAVQINIPLGTTPALAQWLVMDDTGSPVPVGTPFFTSVTVLGRLLAQGIVAIREADPEALMEAFELFFATNEEFLGDVSDTLGISLIDSLMPIIMASPAEGIENFFNTIMGMLGVTDLSEVIEGDVDFSALLALLGM